MWNRLRVGVTATVLVAASVAGCSTTPVSAATPIEAAERLCPLMWDWVKAVGDSFNGAASDVATIDEPEDRRRRWSEALVEVEALNQQLLTDLEPLNEDPILAPLVAEIRRDMRLAAVELDDIRQLLVDSPQVDQERHQVRTSQIIVRIEKVIDLPKPDLGPHDTDGTLLEAFRTVPSCQHAIRGVNDGGARANG